MSRFPSSRAARGLLGAALALCTNLPEAQATLSGLPDPVALELVDEVERAGVETRGRQRLLAGLAQDRRAAIRERVAAAAGRLPASDASFGSALLAQLADDAAPNVGAAAARGLGRLLTTTTDPLRASIESYWALAPSARRRFALGLAMGLAPCHFLTDFVVQELAGDGDASVRWAALSAARAHLDTDPPGYTRLAARHVDDPDRAVRAAARGLLRSAERRGWAVADRPTVAERRANRQRFRRALRASAARIRPAGAPADLDRS